MPKYKNEKVVYSRFKAQILIRSKGHLDLFSFKSLQGGTFINLLFHRIFSEFEGKIFSSWKIQTIDVASRNIVLDS
jgi:hypothetical protein